MTSLLSMIKTTGSSKEFQQSSLAPLYKIKTTEDGEFNPEVQLKKISAPTEITFNIEKLKNLEELVKKLKEHIANYYDTKVNNNFKQSPKKAKKHCKKKKATDTDLSHCTRHSHILEPSILSSLKKCLEKDSFWHAESFKLLVENNLITARSYKTACSCVLKFKCFEILDYYADKEKVFGEDFIIKCIKEIISELTDEKMKEFHESSYTFTDMEPFIENLMRVFTLPIDENQLRDYLKLLSSNEAIVVLQILRNVLSYVSLAFQPENRSLDLPKELTLSKVVCWLNCLISAKLPSFLISTSLQSVVLSLNNTIKRQESFYRDISTLRPYLEHLKSKRKLPPEESQRKYKIEKVFL